MEHARKERIKFENQITEDWYNLKMQKMSMKEKIKLSKREQLLKDMESKQAQIQDLDNTTQCIE